ncbi:MAG TPA: hypothetical protein VK718_11560 [Ferruginibacter sp.]|jgi:hypothetical protein|nr:hypothetical protein [Ferruginibacter sp.]
MINDSRFIIIAIFALSILAILQYKEYRNDKVINRKNCETIKMSINGVITESWGRNSYAYIYVNNIKDYIGVGSLSNEISQKWFNNNYCFEIGDSVIKKANSSVITFKRSDSTITYKIECDN